MPDCTSETLPFARFKRRDVQVSFDAGDVSSDAGLLLLHALDRRLGLLEAVAARLGDGRDRKKIEHSVLDLLRQRVFALVQGYEDLNDHDALRHDVLMQTACERDVALASPPTLCRFDNGGERAHAFAVHEVIVEQFIASFKRAPKELVLDFDATDTALHGEQQGRFFHGYYDHYCYLPLYVFCGERLLVAYLRASKIDAAKHAGAILKLLVARLRRAWPKVRIVFRADSGFCRQPILNWCERNAVHYVVGLARNARLHAMVEPAEAHMGREYESSGIKQRRLLELRYGARSWKRARRCVARLEFGQQGTNARFVVSNITITEREAGALYDALYCQRGEAENRIKEAQLGLFADRTSAHHFAANQFRLLLSALAYVLVERLRALALSGTAFARLQAPTLRSKLLKIGAVIVRNTRRVRVMLSSSYPYQAIFAHAAHMLHSP